MNESGRDGEAAAAWLHSTRTARRASFRSTRSSPCCRTRRTGPRTRYERQSGAGRGGGEPADGDEGVHAGCLCAEVVRHRLELGDVYRIVLVLAEVLLECLEPSHERRSRARGQEPTEALQQVTELLGILAELVQLLGRGSAVIDRPRASRRCCARRIRCATTGAAGRSPSLPGSGLDVGTSEPGLPRDMIAAALGEDSSPARTRWAARRSASRWA